MNDAQRYIEERTERITETGCWVWMLSKMPTGWPYGQCTINKRHMYAHRVSWEAYNGPIPEGMHVLHRCDNPPCCNPDHLFLGKDKENKEDQVKKGRSLRGENHNMVKLTEAQVIDAFYSTEPYKVIAQRLNCSVKNIQAIKYGYSWKHLNLLGS